MQFLEALAHFGDREAELRAVPPDDCQRPPPRAASLTRMPMLRPDADFLRVLEHEAQLGVLLDHRDDVPADLVGQHRHLDELGVLEAVADDRRVVVGHGHHGQQLGLGAGLEAEAVGRAEIEDFLDHLALLVDLDRVDENVGQAVAKDVAEANQDWQPDAAQLQVIDQLLKVDRALRFLGDVRQHVAVGADREIAPWLQRSTSYSSDASVIVQGSPCRLVVVGRLVVLTFRMIQIFAGRYRTNRALVRVTIRPP